MTANLVQGAHFTVMVIRIGDIADPEFERALEAQVARSPQFFANAPVVLDLKGNLGFHRAADFIELRKMLRRVALMPVGVQNADSDQQRAALEASLAAFAGTPSHRRAPQAAASDPAPEPAALAPPPRPADATTARSMLVTEPVRSGTQLYARGGDLIILRSVSAGAEIIADGHIHVYGTLRGRAIAGAMGDSTARIFVDRLEADLVSIAGRYLVSDKIPPEHVGQRAQIMLQEQRVVILRS
jgi:septum site-determining protein MinC